jgi:hypothetical protein
MTRFIASFKSHFLWKTHVRFHIYHNKAISRAREKETHTRKGASRPPSSDKISSNPYAKHSFYRRAESCMVSIDAYKPSPVVSPRYVGHLVEPGNCGIGATTVDHLTMFRLDKDSAPPCTYYLIKASSSKSNAKLSYQRCCLVSRLTLSASSTKGSTAQPVREYIKTELMFWSVPLTFATQLWLPCFDCTYLLYPNESFGSSFHNTYR